MPDREKTPREADEQQAAERAEHQQGEREALAALHLQGIIYIVGMIAVTVVICTTPPDLKMGVAGVVIAAFLGGQNVVKTRQGYQIQRQVQKDLLATQGVEKTLNGGFNARIKGVVREVMHEDLPRAIIAALDEREKGRVRT